MAKFTDAKQREWVFRITNKTVRDIKFALSIDLRELLNDECKPLMEMISDSLKLSQVLFVACRDQLSERNVSEDDFLDGIYGDVSEKAAEAFCEAFIDFFPNPQLRKSITELLGLVRELHDEIVGAAASKVTEAIASTDKSSIVKSIEQRASSESTPTQERCENCSGCSKGEWR